MLELGVKVLRIGTDNSDDSKINLNLTLRLSWSLKQGGTGEKKIYSPVWSAIKRTRPIYKKMNIPRKVL